MTIDEAMARILEEEAEATRRLLEQEFRGHKVADLSKVFDAIADPNDWRAPIEAWIDQKLFGIAAVAVEFFTSTELRVVAGPQALTGYALVQADGYRNGPAGP